ncbi:serine hydroxymethyltransferase [candidate division WWE3 bacterium CG_4_9_14_3_um_filter_41_6]|nr:MAG: serine hydroxymethyltransferase [candidate division WWE3 bacterium CG_4_9_14_3_um_filter_41_6]
MSLSNIDPEIFTFLTKESLRQREQLQMIPSENYTSRAVQEAVGSVLMNKYSEGQVGKRYYQGNFFIDRIEEITKSRALTLFNLDKAEWGVNVQAVTGSVANLAVYSALIEPGDTIMGMFLYHGGHLSHGWQLPDGKKVSFTSHIYNPTYYYVNEETQTLDYDDVQKQAHIHNPKIIISGGTAYPREINHKKMREIADSVGAYYLADIAHEAGLVATGVNASPFEYAHVVTMTTRKTLRGPVGAIIFTRNDLIAKINRAVFPGLQGGPQNHSIAGIGVCLHEAMQPAFHVYAKQVIKNAQMIASELIKRDYNVISGGTDKHLVLVNLENKGITGKEAAIALEKANIIVNANTVPGSDAKPMDPSGIRLGSPALTSRGMKTTDMQKIAGWIDTVISNPTDENIFATLANEVKTFALNFPVPGLDD